MANIPTISIPGIGSDLDVQGIVDALVNVRREPALERFNSQVTTITNQVSAIGGLRSALSSWQETTFDLRLESTYNTRAVNYDFSSATDYFTVSADTTAALNQYDIEVTQTAQAQKLSTNFSLDSAAPIGGGTLTIDINGNTYDIAVSATDTLSDISNAINTSTGNQLKAATITSGSEVYLTIESTGIGASNAFSISVVDDDGLADASGLSRLQYDGIYNANMTLITAAQDASITIDDVITATSSSNVFENVIQGVTLSVKQAHPSGQSNTFALSLDTDQLKNTFSDFVDRYNQLIDVYDRVTFVNRDLNGQPIEAEDDENIDLSSLTPEERAQKELDKQKGVFASDPIVRSMIYQMRNIISTGVDSEQGSNTLSLAAIGIEMDRYGKLLLDESKLNKAINDNYEQVQTLLTGEDGIATILDTKIKEFEEFGGVLQSKSSRLSENQVDLAKRFDALDQRLQEYESRLYVQYVRLDQTSAAMSATLEYIKQQFASMRGEK